MLCCPLWQDFLLSDVVEEINVLLWPLHDDHILVFFLKVVQELNDVAMVQPQQEGYLLGNKTGANLKRERCTEGGGSPMDSSIYPCQAAQNKACRPLAVALHYTMSPQYEYDLHLIKVNHHKQQ